MSDPSLLEIYRQTNYHFSDILLNIDMPLSKANSLLQPFELTNQKLKTVLLEQGLNVMDGYGEAITVNGKKTVFLLIQ